MLFKSATERVAVVKLPVYTLMAYFCHRKYQTAAHENVGKQSFFHLLPVYVELRSYN